MIAAILLATLKDRSGTTAVEYSLLAGLVALSAIVGLITGGEYLAVIFDSISGNMQTAAVSRQ